MKELTMYNKLHRAKRGQTIVLLAIAMVPLVGMAGLGVDVGRMYTARRRAQEVADIAVAAGAHEQMKKTGKATFTDVVTTYASRNGFSSAKGDIIVTNNPPTSGPYAGNTSAYEVIVKRPVNTALLRVLGSNATTIQGRAVAVVKKAGIGIVVLDPSKDEAFKINKKSKIQLTEGTIYVNSTSNKAIKIEQESQIIARETPQIVGDYEATDTSSISPEPNTKAKALPDPLASLSVPPCSLPARGTGTKDAPVEYHPSNNAVLCPGIYFGGIKLDGSKNITFDNCGVPAAEAVFVVTQKGLHVHDADLTANNVMIYNAPEQWCKSTTNKCGSIHFDKKADVNLTPPTSGPYEGIAIFQDRSCTKALDISGRALSGIAGDVYAAKGELKVKGKKKSGGSGVIKASFVVRLLRIGNHIGADDGDLDVDETEEETDTDLDATWSSQTGGSASRVVISE
jgi:Flp pilus assembly protein TadG